MPNMKAIFLRIKKLWPMLKVFSAQVLKCRRAIAIPPVKRMLGQMLKSSNFSLSVFLCAFHNFAYHTNNSLTTKAYDRCNDE